MCTRTVLLYIPCGTRNTCTHLPITEVYQKTTKLERSPHMWSHLSQDLSLCVESRD